MASTQLSAKIIEDACMKAIADLTDAVTRGVQSQATLDSVRGMWAIAVASRLSAAGLSEPEPITLTGEEALLILDHMPTTDAFTGFTGNDETEMPEQA